MRRLVPLILATPLGCYVGIPNPELGQGSDTSSATATDDPGDGDPGDGDPGDGDGDPGDGDGGPGDGDGVPGDGDGVPGDGDGVPGDGDGDPNATVCERWTADRANLAEGSWSGSVNGCSAGDMDPAWRARSLAIVNLYRWLAELPPITTDPTRDMQAQACALMMQANNALNHSPPMNWTCYSGAGASGAGNSNIAGTAAVQAVDLYMVDYGNESTLGHRRWILSNSIGPTGIGSTDGYSCMWTLGGNGNANKPWMAWPPPGEVPFGIVNPLWWGDGIDESGWSIQSDSISLNGAQVTITGDGQNLPVSVNNLAGGYGSQSAISIIPSGWSTQVGVVYHVEVANTEISYDVEFIDCG